MTPDNKRSVFLLADKYDWEVIKVSLSGCQGRCPYYASLSVCFCVSACQLCASSKSCSDCKSGMCSPLSEEEGRGGAQKESSKSTREGERWRFRGSWTKSRRLWSSLCREICEPVRVSERERETGGRRWGFAATECIRCLPGAAWPALLSPFLSSASLFSPLYLHCQAGKRTFVPTEVRLNKDTGWNAQLWECSLWGLLGSIFTLLSELLLLFPPSFGAFLFRTLPQVPKAHAKQF